MRAHAIFCDGVLQTVIAGAPRHAEAEMARLRKDRKDTPLIEFKHPPKWHIESVDLVIHQG